MEEDKDFKNIWKVYRSSETERVRSNTLPGLLPSNKQSFECNPSGNLHALIRPYSCELYGSNRELSIRFQDRMLKVNSDRVSTWVFPHYNHGIENLNWSMQCNQGSFIRNTTPMKDQLEHMEHIESASQSTEEYTANQPEEAGTIKSVIFSKKTSLRPKLKIKSEKQKPEKRQGSNPVNEDNITPTKKWKDYDDVSDNLRSIAPSDSSAISTADSCDEREDLQAKHPLKAKKNFLTCKRSMFVLLLSTILVTFISVYLYENQETRKHSNDFANAVVELKERIYGHNNLHKLCEYLQSDVPSFKVIVLFGDTGVGKSYTVDIIRRNFPRKYAIRQYFPPLEAVNDINLPLLYPNLIILENLKKRDLMDFVNFLEARRDIYKDHFVTVLAIFNFEDLIDLEIRIRNRPHDAAVIENAFLNKNIEVETFFYEPLNEDALDGCIIDAIKESKLTLNEEKFDLVKESLLIHEAGCKRAYRYVQVIGRQHE
ncbi:PREDICTED: uncharacterized protein LOC108757876 [Trachymyrmex cornetzi]|uniref:uncharacterized protein LOC108757876 n=1 Tax=Trachymyrmex cornetzi TaxID=471704 RepID=UPI00084ED9D6|nr:PREDICTED: uncharacterized protein LOC108757876 [Trachymyrmex cornetzi]